MQERPTLNHGVVVVGDTLTTDTTGQLWAGNEMLGNRINGSDLYGHWVSWPGSGGPWPVGYYLGVSRANNRRMWLTVSPLSGVPIRMHIPEDARIVEGQFLGLSHFPPLQPEWLDYPLLAQSIKTPEYPSMEPQVMDDPCTCSPAFPDPTHCPIHGDEHCYRSGEARRNLHNAHCDGPEDCNCPCDMCGGDGGAA